MREFTHQIRFEDVITKTDAALYSIDPTVIHKGEKVNYTSVKVTERITLYLIA